MNNEYILSKSIMISILMTTYNNHSFYQFLIFTRSARIGETSIHLIIFIQILVIDLDSTFKKELGSSTVCRLGISIHHSIIQYHTRKSN